MAILRKMSSLDFDRIKYLLLEFLNNRLRVPGRETEIEMPSTWSMSDPEEVFNALKTIHLNSQDCKIHRAYGQIHLYELVEETRAHEVTHATSRQGSGRIALLDKMAKDSAGDVSKKETNRMKRNFQSESAAGKRWLKIFQLFGNSGIVLIFVCGGT